MDAGMTSKFPWDVKGVREEPRVTAREAARRSGVSVGERLESLTRQLRPKRALDADLAEVKSRLDAVTQQLDERPASVSQDDIDEIKARLETLALTLDQRQSRALEDGLGSVKAHVETLAQ